MFAMQKTFNFFKWLGVLPLFTLWTVSSLLVDRSFKFLHQAEISWISNFKLQSWTIIFFSSDIERLNSSIWRVFTNFDPVIGSETVFKSHRKEVFISWKPENNETFHFDRNFVNTDSFSNLSRAFYGFLELTLFRICSHMRLRRWWNDCYSWERSENNHVESNLFNEDTFKEF